MCTQVDLINEENTYSRLAFVNDGMVHEQIIDPFLRECIMGNCFWYSTKRKV